MQRLTRTATNVIAAIVALAGIVIIAGGMAQEAALAMGFIPARLSGVPVNWTAVPALLTPLTASLVHEGLIQLGFNLLILVWCGAAVERVLGKTGVIVLYVAGAYAAALAQWSVDPAGALPIVGAGSAVSAVLGAFALSFGRAKRVTSSPALNRCINALWLLVAWVVLQLMMGWLGGQQGFLLATPAHMGGFAAGLLLQRPLLLWRYRKA
jgi:membrane associated rhomboid family serine protease